MSCPAGLGTVYVAVFDGTFCSIKSTSAVETLSRVAVSVSMWSARSQWKLANDIGKPARMSVAIEVEMQSCY
jgi:hypothetical protein